MRYHPEKIPSAIERYQKEIVRVFSVLDSVLAKQEWLVGGKPTIADLSFIPWNRAGIKAAKDLSDVEKEFPHFYAYVCSFKHRCSFAFLVNRVSRDIR